MLFTGNVIHRSSICTMKNMTKNIQISNSKVKFHKNENKNMHVKKKGFFFFFLNTGYME